jgi:hypothetical protein
LVLIRLPRVVCRFSCGAASAVAAKLAIHKYGDERIVVTYSDPGSESSDNPRFLRDCERWLGVEIITLPKGKYADTWAVWEGERFITSHAGAPCTGFLKRQPAMAFARPDDITVFGYTADGPDIARASRLREQNFEISIETPLIDAGLTKTDCLAMVERAGIAIPEMYLLGYHNNNCIGCCKAGMGYWNKIRVDFPEVFERMATLQRRLGDGSALWREDDGTPILLDNLDPSRGKFDAEPKGECSLLCYMAEQEMEAAR